MSKLSAEIAKKEALKWLASTGIKSVSETDIQKLANLNVIVDAFMDGTLVLEESGLLKQTLIFPVGEKESIKAITYKNRLNVGDIVRGASCITTYGPHASNLAYMTELCQLPLVVIEAISHLDYKIAASVVFFF